MKFNYEQIKDRLLSYILIKILEYKSKDSNRVAHAKNEFDLTNCNDDFIQEDVLNLIRLFSIQGHSGCSSRYCIDLFTKLANLDIISPLTLEDDEFKKGLFGDDYYQNKRKGNIFKDDKGIYSIDYFIKEIKYIKRFQLDDIIESTDNRCYGGRVYHMKNGIATGLYFNKVYFKKTEAGDYAIKYHKTIPTIVLPVTEVEIDKDDWLMFVDDEELKFKELYQLYDIDWQTENSLKDRDIKTLDNYKPF